VSWDETLERVRSAAEFCASSGLTRFRIDEDDLEIEVRRSAPSGGLVPAAGTAAELAEEAHGPSNGAIAPEEPRKTFKAEFVGIVRFSRPAVSEGTLVGGDRELAYVESLGIRNPVRSGGPCRVAEIFVSDGQPVGFGQPLLTIEPSDV
jgi:acetyl-CoA carboxylase biotin carboxyl carrier protein